jgi:hypothetical protein
MEIPESQWGIIWKAIEYWRGARHLGLPHFSLLVAGVRGAYTPQRIARGIQDGSERITSELLHTCVRIFGLVSARQSGLDDNLTDEECIELLTAPLKKNTAQGKFQL